MLKLPTSRAEAQGLAEYGLVLALVSLASILAIVAVGVILLSSLRESCADVTTHFGSPQTCQEGP